MPIDHLRNHVVHTMLRFESGRPEVCGYKLKPYRPLIFCLENGAKTTVGEDQWTVVTALATSRMVPNFPNFHEDMLAVLEFARGVQCEVCRREEVGSGGSLLVSWSPEKRARSSIEVRGVCSACSSCLSPNS